MSAFASPFAVARSVSPPRLAQRRQKRFPFRAVPNRGASITTVRCVASSVPKTEPSLSAETKAIITATVPALKKHGVEIVTNFYDLLFERHPAVQRYFNMDRQAKGKTMTEGTPAQIAALARSVLAYAANIEDLTPILPRITAICHKHVSRGVIGPHCTYPYTKARFSIRF